VKDDHLAAELRNFEEIAALLEPSPGGIPRLRGAEISGLSKPLTGAGGGDHIIYIDFKQRYDLERRIAKAEAEGRQAVADKLRACRGREGSLIADVSGHRVTDGLIAAMLHQAFLLGVYYELDRFGEITTKLFEHLNQRFYRTTSVNRFVTMLYGELSERGRFRFISAGHQPPMVFSRERRRFVELSPERLVSFPPVGMFASRGDAGERVDPGWLGYKDPYTVNEIDLLAKGDLILLATDGLIEHCEGAYFPVAVERALAESVDRSAAEICEHLWRDASAAGPPKDDLSLVVIKKTAG